MTASYDVNNHQGGEDANGNPSSVPWPSGYFNTIPATYDVENRLVAVGNYQTTPMYYSYDPANHRVWRGTSSGGTTDEIAFWSISGRKLATYQIAPSGCVQTGINYYFGSMLIKDNNGWVYPDRLGSIGKFYPYGAERPSATTNGTEKFTGYFRDSETGNDYAVNRYESPGTGRFLTPDSLGSPNTGDPGSWNKYAYVGGDPINRKDPGGSDYCTVGVGEYAETVYCEQFTVYNGPVNPQCMLILQAARQGNPSASALYAADNCPGSQGVQAGPQKGNAAQGIVGISIAENALRNNSTCASAIGGKGAVGAALANLLDMISIVPAALPFSATLMEGQGGAYTYNIQYEAGYAPGNGTIQLNNNPALQNPAQVPVGTLSSGQPAYGNLLTSMEGQYNLMPGSLDTATFWAIFELHEFAHVEGGIPNDKDDVAQSLANTGTVINACFGSLLKQ